MIFQLNGQVSLLDAKKSLKDHGVKHGDIIVIFRKGDPAAQPGGAGDAPTTEASSLSDEDDETNSVVLSPEEQVRQAMVDDNYEEALEHLPESFGQVLMLFIDAKLNGHPVKAFVDSGAQSTTLSHDLAKRCNLTDLIDTRCEGTANGIGTQKILGRVYLAQIQVGDVFLNSSFLVLEKLDVGIIIGLDMLRSHQCVIDLERNVLVIGTTKTEARFLPEAEIPKFDLYLDSEQDEKSGSPNPEDLPDSEEKSPHGKKRPASPSTQNSGVNKKSKKA